MKARGLMFVWTHFVSIFLSRCASRDIDGSTGDDKKSCDEVHFVANNGELDLHLNPETHFLERISFQVKPPGAPEGFVVRVNGTFSPRVSAEPPIAFTAGSRSAVSNLTELTSKRLAPGSAAPEFALETLDGKKVALRDLRGSVVILDFWATWCVPCWKALKETQSLADWAAAEKLPVRVFAVNTLEQGSDTKEKLKRVQAFWRSQGFTMLTLFDSDSEMFKAIRQPGSAQHGSDFAIRNNSSLSRGLVPGYERNVAARTAGEPRRS
jgi:peroxiredoxin